MKKQTSSKTVGVVTDGKVAFPRPSLKDNHLLEIKNGRTTVRVRVSKKLNDLGFYISHNAEKTPVPENTVIVLRHFSSLIKRLTPTLIGLDHDAGLTVPDLVKKYIMPKSVIEGHLRDSRRKRR
jgi:hypothetical protein